MQSALQRFQNGGTKWRLQGVKSDLRGDVRATIWRNKSFCVCSSQITFAMQVRVKQESQDEALVPLCSKTNGAAGLSVGPMQKVPSLSDLSDPESSLGEFHFFFSLLSSPKKTEKKK